MYKKMACSTSTGFLTPATPPESRIRKLSLLSVLICQLSKCFNMPFNKNFILIHLYGVFMVIFSTNFVTRNLRLRLLEMKLININTT